MDPNNNLTGNNPTDNTTPGVTPVDASEAPQQPLSGPIDLSGLDSQFGTESVPEASEEPIAPETPPEPIVPSAPLPGSIGSVASGAPLSADGPAPAAPAAPATPVTPEVAPAPAPVTPLPAAPAPVAPVTPVEPAPMPAPTPVPTPESAPIAPEPAPEPIPQAPQIPEAPSFAPAQPIMEQPPSVSTAPIGPAPTENKPKSKIIIILLIVLAVLILGLGAFAAAQILGNNGDGNNNNNQSSTTTPEVTEPEKVILACTLDGSDEDLATMGDSVTAFNQQYTVNYEDDELTDISTVSTITFDTAENATNSIAGLEESYKTYYTDELKLTTDPFKSTFITDKDEPTKLIITHFATNDTLTANTSKFFNLNSTSADGGYLTSQSDIKKLYEGMGLTCTSRNATTSGTVTLNN